MADVFLGSVYAKLELRDSQLSSSIASAKRTLGGLDSSMGRSASSGEKSAGRISAAYGAVAGVVQSLTTKAFDSLTASIGGGIKRFDTLKNYPKIMQNLGYSAQESEKSIQKLSDGAQGLPTALNDLASSTKALTPFSDGLEEATDLSLALNDAFLANGASAADTSRGLTQYTQMLAKGKVDMGAWNTLQETMGSSLQQVAKKLGIASGNTKELYDKLKDGELSFGDFNKAVLALDKEGLPGFKNFRDQAFDATGGIQTAVDNLGNAFNRFWEGMIKSVGSENITGAIKEIGNSAVRIGKIIGGVLKTIMPYVKTFFDFLVANGPIVEKVLLGIVVAFAGFKIIGGVVKFVKPLVGLFGLLGKTSKTMKHLTKGGTSVGGGIGHTIASIFKPLGNKKVLLGAASVAVIGVGLISLAYAFGVISRTNFDAGKLGLMAAGVATTALIFSLVGRLAKYSIVGGIATAVIGVGLMSISAGLTSASEAGGKINLMNLGKLSLALLGATAVMFLMSKMIVFSTIGTIATLILSGGLLVTAMALAEVTKYIPKIKKKEIMKLAGTIGIVGTILGLVAGFAALGVVTSVASTIIGGGLLLTAISLERVTRLVREIDMGKIVEFSGMIAQVSAILAAISVLSTFSAIGTIVTAVISGGILLAAKQILEATKYAEKISPEKMDKIHQVLKKISELDTGGILNNLKNMVNSNIFVATGLMIKNFTAIMASVKAISPESIESIKKNMKSFSELETGGIIGNISNMINSGIMTKIAYNIKSIVDILSGVKALNSKSIDSLKDNLTNLSKLETEGVIESLQDMWASGNIAKVAENVKKVIESLSNLTAPDEDSVNALKSVMSNLSSIDIKGNGWFQNKGEDAAQVARIASSIRSTAENLANLPKVGKDDVSAFVGALKAFEEIDDETRAGVLRLASLRDSLGNVNWIKYILGDIPSGIDTNGEKIVAAMKHFSGIDEGTRDGALRLARMRDALGNLDWIKHILGDVPSNIATNAANIVTAVQKFSGVEDSARDGVMRIASLRDALGNINWVKHILGDVPQDLEGKSTTLVAAINKLGEIDVNGAKMNGLGNNLIQNLVKGINDSVGSVEGAAGRIQSELWLTIQNRMNDEYYQGMAMASKFIEGLSSRTNSISRIGHEMQSTLWRAIQARMNDQYHQGSAMSGRFAAGLRSRNGEISASGAHAAQGFINGANSRNAYSTGWSIASQFLAGLKARGREGSPWKTTIQSGAWAGEGFANGIRKSESLAVRAGQRLADSVKDVMSIEGLGEMSMKADLSSVNSFARAAQSSVEVGDTDRANEVSIYGNISINSNATDGEGIMQDLARATQLTDKGMAVGV